MLGNQRITAQMSSLVSEKLDKLMVEADTSRMSTPVKAIRSKSAPSIAESIRQRIDLQGESYWRQADFRSYAPDATAQTLSRLAREGFLKRIAKGVYYRPGKSVFGETRPNPTTLLAFASQKHRLFPAGLSAAKLLGFTTQNPACPELATTARSVPRRFLAPGTIVHTRRPAEWERLSDEEGAILDLLRTGASMSELEADATASRLLELLAHRRRYSKLVEVAQTEPPRVLAILGAAGQELGMSATMLNRIRAKLNPLSKFDFGKLAGLKFAKEWKAKEASNLQHCGSRAKW